MKSIIRMRNEVLNKIYEHIFKEKITENVEVFLKHLSYVSLGVLVESILTFVYQIVGGKVLGPTEYGRFTLISSVGMFLYVPMFFGINTAMVKYNTEKKEFRRQQDIISTSIFLTLMLTISWTIIYLFNRSAISTIFCIDENTFYHTIAFTLLYGFYVFATDTLRSLHEIKKFSKMRPFFGGILLFGLISYTILTNKNSFLSMIIPMYLAYFIIGAVAIFIIRRYVILTFCFDWAKTLMKYGMFNMVNGISFVLFANIDKILINRYMFTKDVGLYNAYSISSLKIISIFTVILVTVLFPMISQYDSKNGVLRKFYRILPYIIIIGIPFIISSEYIILILYGDEYPLYFSLIILFAISSILFLIYDIYVWIVNSIGIKGVQLSMYVTSSIALLDVILDMCFIPKYGIQGAIGATAISYFVGNYILYMQLKRIKSEI